MRKYNCDYCKCSLTLNSLKEISASIDFKDDLTLSIHLDLCNDCKNELAKKLKEYFHFGEFNKCK